MEKIGGKRLQKNEGGAGVERSVAVQVLSNMLRGGGCPCAENDQIWIDGKVSEY